MYFVFNYIWYIITRLIGLTKIGCGSVQNRRIGNLFILLALLRDVLNI